MINNPETGNVGIYWEGRRVTCLFEALKLGEFTVFNNYTSASIGGGLHSRSLPSLRYRHGHILMHLAILEWFLYQRRFHDPETLNKQSSSVG
jgi:hypothetical protein